MGTYDGTVVGSPTFGAAKFTNGLTSVTNENYVRLPNSLFQFGAAFTIELWLKDGTTAIGVALSSDGSYNARKTIWIGTLADAKFAASFYSGTTAKTLTSDVASNDGNWHHIAFISTGSAVTFYVDGVLKDTEAVALTNPEEGATYYGALGWLSSAATPFSWQGDIDEVAFWDIAKYTENFTPPTSAYAGTEANLRALYHVESDGTDDKFTANVIVGTPTFAEYSPTTIDFSWAAASGGTAPYSYQVQISTNGTDYTNEGALQSGLTYSDTGLTASTPYYYRIVATDANSETGTSDAATKTTLAEGVKYNRRDLTGAASSQAIMVLIPNANSAVPYSAGTATPLLMYHSGSNEDEGALLDDALKADVVDALLDAGYICCGIAAGNNWGSQAACNYYSDLYYTVDLYYNLSYTLFLSQSMGGLTGLLCLAQNEVPGVIAWAGIYPAVNLGAIYTEGTFAAAINSAYSCVAGTYAAKTYGHDPCLKWGKAFRGVPMRFYASESDATIIKDNNTDIFQPIISGSCTESTIQVCTGDHGDPSHFQPSDLVAFYERALANPIASSGLGSGGAVRIQSIGKVGL